VRYYLLYILFVVAQALTVAMGTRTSPAHTLAMWFALGLCVSMVLAAIAEATWARKPQPKVIGSDLRAWRRQ